MTRRFRGSALVALGVLAACGLVTSCTPRYRPLAVESSGGATTAVWRECAAKQHNGIYDLALYRGDSSVDTAKVEPIWKIHTVGRTPSTVVRIGEAPPGFITDAPLQQPLAPGDTFTLIANDGPHGVWGSVTFRPQMLQRGTVTFDDQITKSAAQYTAIPDDYFGC